MSKPRKNTKRNTNPPASPATGKATLRLAVLALAVAIVAAGGLWWSKGRHTDAPIAVAPPTATNATNLPAPGASSNAKFEKLQGKWMRPDGGYILEIRSATAEGKLDAGYFNPRPINVAKAVALQDGLAVKVFVELRDVNYPGSTYTLVYEAESDQLKGIYYQAAMQQQYEVFFERVK
jgi:hypothetical protein